MGGVLVLKRFWLSPDMTFPWESNIKIVNHFGESVINLILFTSLYPETIKCGCLSCFQNVLFVSWYDISMRIKYKNRKSFRWNYYQTHFIHLLVSWDNKIWVSFLFFKCFDCLNIWDFLWESNIKVVNLWGETIINLIIFASLYAETIIYEFTPCF